MAHTILRIAFAAVLVVSSAGFGYGQTTGGTGTGDVAIVPPGAPLPDMQTVLDQCSIVDAAGACTASTDTYLTALDGAGLAPADYSQKLADFVIALTAIAQADQACDTIDAEVAQAIRLAAAQATDPGQVAQFNNIADTVASCSNFATAAIAPPASPA